MYGVISYILMYIGAAVYCGFDSVIKEQTLLHSASPNTAFDIDCVATECLVKTLKFVNDKDKLTEEGFLTLAAVLSDFNSTLVEKAQKELNKCLPEVNQKLYTIPFPKCSKFQAAAKLLEKCVDKKELGFPR